MSKDCPVPEVEYSVPFKSPVKFYKHKYGGIYALFADNIQNKSNNEIMVIYEHVYPFPQKIYTRNQDEFYLSNRELSKDELMVELNKNRLDFQKEINNEKNKKK